MLVANAISFIHFLLILFILFGHTSDSIAVLILHTTTCACLLIHWIAMNNTCSLTLLESKVRGVKNNETFMHRLVSPVYDVHESTLSLLCKVVTALVMMTSSYKLSKSEKFKNSVMDLVKGKDIKRQMKILFSV